MAAIRPDQTQTVGGDLIPTLTGQRNIQDELHRRGKEFILSKNRERAFKTRNAARRMVQAILEKDQDRIDASIAEFNDLIQNEDLRITTDDPFKAALEAMSISWGLRELDRNKKYADELLQMMDATGIKLEP
jgi:hypothetical protein